MRAKDFLNKLDIVKFDTISKFNIYSIDDNFKFFSIKKLKLLSIIESSDKLFYKKFLLLSDISKFFFNQKLSIFNIMNKKYLRKNIICYLIGCTVNNINKINNIVNYINNIMKYTALRIDNNLKLKYNKKYCRYMFSNLNYLLGYDNSKYFNIRLNFNILLIYDTNSLKKKIN